MESQLFLYGGGGHAKVVLDVLQGSGLTVHGIIDSKFDGDLLGVRRYREMPEGFGGAKIIIAIGDNAIRKKISETLTNRFANAVHASALISRHASLGVGTMILHRSIIQGSHVIINTGAQVDHDCTVGNFVHVAPGAVLCGSISIGEGTLVGAGAVIKPGVTIGAWVTIGSGAVVVKDIPDFAVVVGNPAKVIKFING
jgi:sugar O-acyltransferase (sialic acid O-acetyltransferase NeuD family)